MANKLEATRVEYGFGMDSAEGTLEKIRTWARQILAKKGGHVEISDPETGACVEEFVRVEIFDKDGDLNETIYGEVEQVRNVMLDAIHYKTGWVGKYMKSGERGSQEVIRRADGDFITSVFSATDVADWATRKWSEDALYMVAETHEASEVFGIELKDAAVKVLEGRGYNPIER